MDLFRPNQSWQLSEQWDRLNKTKANSSYKFWTLSGVLAHNMRLSVCEVFSPTGNTQLGAGRWHGGVVVSTVAPQQEGS